MTSLPPGAYVTSGKIIDITSLCEVCNIMIEVTTDGELNEKR